MTNTLQPAGNFLLKGIGKDRFRRRTFPVPNLILPSYVRCLSSFGFDLGVKISTPELPHGISSQVITQPVIHQDLHPVQINTNYRII